MMFELAVLQDCVGLNTLHDTLVLLNRDHGNDERAAKV
jgi:hypothetical protein